jgi:mannose-6-phosphate isomerase-like protein (cupin superfamily)
MSSLLRPINLTIRAEDLRSTQATGLAQSIFSQPKLHCDQIDAVGLQTENSTWATHEEVYVIVAGQGALRCVDDTIMAITAGDVLYIAEGTTRYFENLSGKFLALRLSPFPHIKVLHSD